MVIESKIINNTSTLTCICHSRYELKDRSGYYTQFRARGGGFKTYNECDELYPLQNKQHCNEYYQWRGLLSTNCNLNDISDPASIEYIMLISSLLFLIRNDDINSLIHITLTTAFPNKHYVRSVQYVNFMCRLIFSLNKISGFEISTPFCFITCSTTGVNFTCGFYETEKTYNITYSTDDITSYLVKLPKNLLTFSNTYHPSTVVFIDGNEYYNITTFIDRHMLLSESKTIFRDLLLVNPNDRVTFIKSKLVELYDGMDKYPQLSPYQKCFEIIKTL